MVTLKDFKISRIIQSLKQRYRETNLWCAEQAPENHTVNEKGKTDKGPRLLMEEQHTEPHYLQKLGREDRDKSPKHDLGILFAKCQEKAFKEQRECSFWKRAKNDQLQDIV